MLGDVNLCYSESNMETGAEKATTVSVLSDQSTNKGSADGQGRASRRKPVKTHKVSANFEEVDHYDDYLRGGIPDALLDGLGFNESTEQASGSSSPSSSNYAFHIADDSFTAAVDAAEQPSVKRRGRPPKGSRDQDAVASSQTSVVAQPGTTTPKRRRGRPPKTFTPTRVQPVRVTSPGPVHTPPKQTPVQGKLTPVQHKQTPVQPIHSQPVIPRTSQIVKQVTSVPSPLPIIANAAALALLPVSEFNVWPVLEKLLAATQSMGMLLGSLKDDLKRTSASIAAVSGSSSVEHTRKRREVATKLWRAFVAYKKSFDEIESFTRGAGTNNVIGASAVVMNPSSAHKVGNNAKNSVPAAEPSSLHRKEPPTKSTPITKTGAAAPMVAAANAGTRRRPRLVHSDIVIELSDSDKGDSGDEEPTKKKLIKLDDDVAAVHSGSAAMSAAAIDNDCNNKQGDVIDTKVSLPADKQQNDELVGTKGGALAEKLQNSAANENIKQSPASVYEDVPTDCRQSNETEDGDEIKMSTEHAGNDSSSGSSKVSIEDSNGGGETTNTDPKSSSPIKTELFSCLRFEPLFEIQPLNGGKS